MKLITYLSLIFSTLLLAGCGEKGLLAIDNKLAFCDAVTPFTFTLEEAKWRSANAPINLRKELKINGTGVEECGWEIDNEG